MDEISIHKYCQQIEDVIEQGRYAEAVAHGKHILKQYPKHVATYQLLGKAMLEAGQHEYAADMFRRVLSADPENLVAWVGMSEVHDQRGELDAAVWHMERTFELAADNEVVEEELRHFYGRRDGVEPQRVQLTRGALARLYLKGDLLSRAINEFHTLLAEQPERVDLSVALAEALWRNEQRLEASEVCQQVLDVLPYCLKANLILGEIWSSSGREEGQMYLKRAEAVDPENQMAQELFGAASPLPAREARIVPLEYKPPTEDQRPAWMAEIETVSVERPPLTEGETALVDVIAGMEAQIEIPPWLEEVVGEEAPAPTPPSPTEPSEGPPPEEAVPAPAEEVPEWLAGIGEELIGEELVEEKPGAVTEEETPEWLAGLDFEGIGEEAEIPTQPAELRVEPAGMAEASTTPGAEEVPEWVAELDVEAAGEETAPSVTPAEQPPDWLTGIREQFAEEAEVPEETLTPVAEEAPTPAWLEGEELPSGDDALAWLEQLAEGKEEELRAQAQAEAEARMAEIMGRPTPAEVPTAEAAPEEPAPAMPSPVPAEIPDWLQEPAPPAVEAAPEEAVAPMIEEAVVPPAEEAFGEPAVPPEAVAAAEEAPPTEEVAPAAEEAPAPAWLEGEELPSGDEALAWLEQLAEGKEEELRAQAQAEAEARMAEIMGRPTPAEAPTAEAAPEEPAPAMPSPAPAEIPDWLQEPAPPAVEAAPEEAAAPMIEEAVVPPAEEAFGWTAFGEPAAPPEAVAVVEEAPPTEEVAPAAEEAPTPAWLEGEELPSGDEALAWLEQLAEGKEEELRAQAQAEAEARMAEIMGRPTPAEAAPEEAVAPMIEEAIIPPAEEAFGWTAFGEPAVPPEAVAAAEEAPLLEEAAPAAEEAPTPAWLEGEELPSGDEALAWLEQLAEGKEEELRAQAQAEAEARMAEIMGRPTPAEAAPEEAVAPMIEEAIIPPAEEAFGWTAFGEPAAPPEAVAVVEETPPVEEVAPPEIPEPAYLEEVEEVKVAPALEFPAVEEALPPEEIPAPEIAPPTEEVRWGAALEVLPEEEVTPAPVIEEIPGIPEMEILEAVEEVTTPPEAPTVEVPAGPFGAEQAYLKEHPRDYEAWLMLARALWQAGERQEALEAYTRVIRSGKLLESVIPDLEKFLEQWPEVSTQRVLGDAYMKDGRLQEALDIYRHALETL